jgi:hypothetical protein
MNCIAENEHEIDEAALFKTSVAPPQKLDSSAVIFSSPKKKDPKRRRRKIDVERQEQRQKQKLALAKKFQSEKEVERVIPYGRLLLSSYVL